MIEITPYERVGPIAFGMTADEVSAVAGSPSQVITNRKGERDERRNNIKIRYSKDDEKVVEIALLPPAAVTVCGVNVFNDASAFERLIALDGQPFEFLGFVILPKLGITLTGFHDGDESQKALTAFALGRWDYLRPQFTPFPAKSM